MLDKNHSTVQNRRIEGYQVGLYGVKALSQYTGINAHTLRIWERRYGVVAPSRAENGRRVYTQADAERLCLIAALTAKGHGISAVATLSLADLESLVTVTAKRGDVAKANGPQGGAEERVSAMLLDRMVAALEDFRLGELSSQLAMARLHCSVADFIYQLVLPLIGRIGALVDGEKLSIAHEHALSAILKTHIYQAIYNLGSTKSRIPEGERRATPSITIATQEGDHHEFGILLASLLAESRGLTTHFFGCNMPAKSLAGAANALRSPIILVGRTIRLPAPTGSVVISQKNYLKELDQSLITASEIWVGGLLEPNGMKFRARHKIQHIPSLQELDRRFSEL